MEWLFGLLVGIAILAIGVGVLAWLAAVVIGAVAFAVQLVVEKLRSESKPG